MKSKYVAVEIGGKISVHLPHATGNYYTLCGIDADDPFLSMRSIDVPDGVKVDCLACFQMWDVARKFELSDFTHLTPVVADAEKMRR